MATRPGALLTECQFALRLTQEGLGELLGRTRRTIQRWQEGGFLLMPDQAKTLAEALRPERPDLADRILELGRQHALVAGIAPANVPASPEVIDAILRAAGEAAGTSPGAIRPAIVAAMRAAEEAGVDVAAVVAGLA
jgi:hypothetical protein